MAIGADGVHLWKGPETSVFWSISERAGWARNGDYRLHVGIFCKMATFVTFGPKSHAKTTVFYTTLDMVPFGDFWSRKVVLRPFVLLSQIDFAQKVKFAFLAKSIWDSKYKGIWEVKRAQKSKKRNVWDVICLRKCGGCSRAGHVPTFAYMHCRFW